MSVSPAQQTGGAIPKADEPQKQLPKKNPTSMKIFNKPDSITAVATVGLAAIVAIIYFLQWRAMVSTMDTARQASERDERAWIVVKHGPTPTLIVGEPVRIDMSVTNVGKTPARSVKANYYLDILTLKEPQNFNYDGDLRPHKLSTTGEIFPSGSMDTVAERFRRSPKTGQEEVWNLEPQESADLNNGDAYLLIHGRVRYDDIFHVSHWKDFCSYVGLKNGINYPTGSCIDDHNISDDNPEP